MKMYMFFWNARGVVSELIELFDRLKFHGVSFAGIMETNVYGEDLSSEKYKFIRGPEIPPPLGASVARRGLGAFVDRERHPGAHRIWMGVHAFCVKIPAKSPNNKPLFVITTHIPMSKDPVGRTAAFAEIKCCVSMFREQGTCIIGGDYNARCALNGDAVLKKSGTQLFDFCDDNGLTLVNSLEAKCVGEYTRTVVCVRNGKMVKDESTIDYVVMDQKWEHLAMKLSLLEKEDLVSDHKPLVLELLWENQPVRHASPWN